MRDPSFQNILYTDSCQELQWSRGVSMYEKKTSSLCHVHLLFVLSVHSQLRNLRTATLDGL